VPHLQKLNILIVTAWYYPFIHPRPHRWTSIAEHWAQQGHTVHVVTARRKGEPLSSIRNGVHLHRTGFEALKEMAYYFFGEQQARGRAGLPVQQPSVFSKIAMWCYQKIWKNLYFPDDACLWYFPARKKAAQLCRQHAFDAVITVSLPFTGQLIGQWLKQKMPHLLWISDIGDPFSFADFPLNNQFLYGSLNKKLEQSALEMADCVVVTTENTRQQYQQQFGAKAVQKMQVIPPLLHPAPTYPSTRTSLSTRQKKIKIGYFGALYAPVRTPDVFLALLQQTLSARPALADTLEVHFYGEIFPEFYAPLRRFPLITLHGLRPRAEVQAAMQQMDLLLNIGNQTHFQLPSKVVDYLAAAKPIVNISYTNPDPFANFFGDWAAILHLKVENGSIAHADVEQWLHYLTAPLPVVDIRDVEQRLQPCLLEALAEGYLNFMGHGFYFMGHG
jgi:hypothetical protein